MLGREIMKGYKSISKEKRPAFVTALGVTVPTARILGHRRHRERQNAPFG